MPLFEEVPLGMIYPSQKSLVLYGEHDELYGGLAVFGYPWKKRSGRVINARAETAAEKPAFRKGIRNYRVVIPASCFYEWDEEKQMIAFDEKDEPVLYMAGFMMEDSFVILTTAANSSVSDVHHRMPLVLKEDEVREWIFDDRKTAQLLAQVPPMMEGRIAG